MIVKAKPLLAIFLLASKLKYYSALKPVSVNLLKIIYVCLLFRTEPGVTPNTRLKAFEKEDSLS